MTAMWEGGNITTNDRIETNYTDLTINYTLPKCPKNVVKYENSKEELKHLHMFMDKMCCPHPKKSGYPPQGVFSPSLNNQLYFI